MTLTELRDALRKATGPDRELSDEIYIQILGYSCRRGEDRILDAWFDPQGDRLIRRPVDLTASIDAAVTLVPSDVLQQIIYQRPLDPHWWVTVWDMPAGQIEVQAESEALSRCLARIKYEIVKAEGPDEVEGQVRSEAKSQEPYIGEAKT